MIVKMIVEFLVWCLVSFIKMKLGKIAGTSETVSKFEKVGEIKDDVIELVKDVDALFETNKKGKDKK